jgi:hypothetical protein
VRNVAELLGAVGRLALEEALPFEEGGAARDVVVGREDTRGVLLAAGERRVWRSAERAARGAGMVFVSEAPRCDTKPPPALP